MVVAAFAAVAAVAEATDEVATDHLEEAAIAVATEVEEGAIIHTKMASDTLEGGQGEELGAVD